MRQNSCKTGQSSFRQTVPDAAAAGKARSPMVARTVRGATSADVDAERSRLHAPRSETR